MWAESADRKLRAGQTHSKCLFSAGLGLCAGMKGGFAAYSPISLLDATFSGWRKGSSSRTSLELLVIDNTRKQKTELLLHKHQEKQTLTVSSQHINYCEEKWSDIQADSSVQPERAEKMLPQVFPLHDSLTQMQLWLKSIIRQVFYGLISSSLEIIFLKRIYLRRREVILYYSLLHGCYQMTNFLR